MLPSLRTTRWPGTKSGNRGAPVYVANSKGGPHADVSVSGDSPGRYSDGEMAHQAYTLHKDDDWGQAGTMVRKVLDDAARDRLVSNIVRQG
ncbi:hypothetical protein [Prescottella agglutinans]|uniref:Uncharacterized protein n=1 Tax=Prescottella agglutinans TaxID=1644129 RepID=A0ABT6M8A4_9NOCA|nr:hypothetical protein [Prescottella agglutinans]